MKVFQENKIIQFSKNCSCLQNGFTEGITDINITQIGAL